MTTLPLLRDVASPALVRGVGLALLHSLWQGGVLALLLTGLLPLLRRQRAELRYAVAAGALAALVLAVGGTFGWYYHSAPLAGAVPVAASVMSPPALAGAVGVGLAPAAVPGSAMPAAPLVWLQVASHQVERYLPLVVVAWLLGLLLMSGRLAGGLLYAGRLRRAGTQTLGAEWQQRLAALAARAGLRQPVALLESARVAGPLVLGHLRPVILLPLGAVAGLSPSLLEALLAHELAHIVRRDYLLNLGLAVAEVLFFYHPAVWFMAHCLRAERENCCDDQAAALCGGDRLRVARALAALAELEAAATPVPRLALAAAGGGRGSLLARVRRLALSRPQAPTLGEGLLAGSLTLLGLLGLSTGVVLAARPAQTVPAQTAPAASSADTARRVATAPALPPLPPLPPTPPEAPRRLERTVQAEVNDEDSAPRLRRLRRLPPRRGRASTVVIEKDKKGRVVSLTVDGQPIETTTPGKKAKRGKAVRTVEVVRQVERDERNERLELVERPEFAERPERPEAPEQRTFSFDFSTTGQEGEARRAAEQGLREALRASNLNAEQRREIERELEQLRSYNAKMSKLHVRPELRNFHLDINGLSDTDRNTARRRTHYEVRARVLTSADAAARRADRAAAEADRAAEQADREADQADREDDRSDLAARRAELRARLAADAAELRALERRESRTPRVPTPLRAPRAPLAPLMPQAPPPPPAPAAPKTAELRAALREDGLIGKNDRNFSFQLTDKGGKVNGRSLTPAQVARYRQLLDQPASGKGQTSTFNINVNEN
ncbi:MAG: M56 family metallopeptidase [Janthinobacterium lividum]